MASGKIESPSYVTETAIKITSYNTSSNQYVAKSDGYLRVKSGDQVNDTTESVVGSSSGVRAFCMAKCQVTNYRAEAMTFVRKGSWLFVDMNTGNRGDVWFIPISIAIGNNS